MPYYKCCAHTIGFSFRLVFTLCKRYDGGNRGEAITVAASGGFVCFWVGLCASVWVSLLRGGFVSFEVGLNASVWGCPLRGGFVSFEVGLNVSVWGCPLRGGFVFGEGIV